MVGTRPRRFSGGASPRSGPDAALRLRSTDRCGLAARRRTGSAAGLCQGDRDPELEEAPVPAVQMTAVSKTYRRRGRPGEKALDGLDLLVESGGVHGFLGPNGSGKTTTIRVLLGLISSDGGDETIRLLDRPVPGGLPDVIGGVGALVETPLFFPNFSGRLNLQL